MCVCGASSRKKDGAKFSLSGRVRCRGSHLQGCAGGHLNWKMIQTVSEGGEPPTMAIFTFFFHFSR